MGGTKRQIFSWSKERTKKRGRENSSKQLTSQESLIGRNRRIGKRLREKENQVRERRKRRKDPRERESFLGARRTKKIEGIINDTSYKHGQGRVGSRAAGQPRRCLEGRPRQIIRRIQGLACSRTHLPARASSLCGSASSAWSPREIADPEPGSHG